MAVISPIEAVRGVVDVLEAGIYLGTTLGVFRVGVVDKSDREKVAALIDEDNPTNTLFEVTAPSIIGRSEDAGQYEIREDYDLRIDVHRPLRYGTDGGESDYTYWLGLLHATWETLVDQRHVRLLTDEDGVMVGVWQRTPAPNGDLIPKLTCRKAVFTTRFINCPVDRSAG